jgi:HNH endonuclease
VKEIPLTRGYSAFVDDADYDWLSEFKWRAHKGGPGQGAPYALRVTSRRAGRRPVLMHREILDAPPGIPVDHVNGKTLDNRRQNLRLATTSLNNANQHTPIRNRVGFIGVFPGRRGRGFVARYKKGGRTIYIGAYTTAEDAARARDEVVSKLYGPFARLNFPGDVAAQVVEKVKR